MEGSGPPLADPTRAPRPPVSAPPQAPPPQRQPPPIFGHPLASGPPSAASAPQPPASATPPTLTAAAPAAPVAPPPMMAPPPAAPSVSPLRPHPGRPAPVAARPPPAPAPPRPAPPPAPQSPPAPQLHPAPAQPPTAPPATPPGARRPQPWRPSAVFEHLPAVPPFARIHPETVALGDVRALHALARQGAWRAVLEKTRAALAGPGAGSEPSRAAPAVASPAWLALKTYHVLALTKLRTPAAPPTSCDNWAISTTRGTTRRRTDPQRCRTRSGFWRRSSPGCWVVRGRRRTRLYALADRCAEETSRAARLAASDPAVASSNPSSGEGGDEGVWRRRRDAAMHAAVNAHVSEGEHLAALARLDWMARCRPANDPDPGDFLPRRSRASTAGRRGGRGDVFRRRARRRQRRCLSGRHR